MTKQQLWKIDKFIVEQVMGWKTTGYGFYPTANLRDAMIALDVLYDWGYSWSIKNETGLPYKKGQEGFTVTFGQYYATANELPMAISLAILNVLQADIDELINKN